MNANNVTEALRRMRKYGFELRITQSIAAASPIERQLHAVQAAASVLYNIDIDQFNVGGNWEPVARHVTANGLREMYKVEASEVGLTAVQIAAVNEAISFASMLLEHAEARPS